MKDICIIGFGLAGMAVTRHAEMRQMSFDVISDGSQMSSKVAGGLLNPVSVKRMKPVWQVENFMDYARSYYSDLSKKLNTELFSEIPIQVYIHNTEQENNWYEAYDNPRIKPFINPKNKHQIKEIGDIQWNTYIQSLQKIRYYHKSRMNILKIINEYLMKQ